MSGPRLGRPREDAFRDKKQEYQDNTDRIAVERAFSLAKRKYGLGLVVTKTGETTKGAIVLSIIAMNVARFTAAFLRAILRKLVADRDTVVVFSQNTAKTQMAEKSAA